MDPTNAKYLELSLGTMSVALRLVRASLVVALIAIAAFVVTLSLGVFIYGPLLAVAGVLLLAAECLFWFGLLRSLLAAECDTDRLLVGLPFVVVPALIAVYVLARTSGATRAPNVEIVFVVGAASVFLAGAMCWVIFLRRQAVRFNDAWVSQQASSLTNRLAAIIALCGLGVGAFWLMAGMAVRNPRTLDPLALLPILPWLVASSLPGLPPGWRSAFSTRCARTSNPPPN